MKNRITLDLNLASKPRRNRRLYDALVRALAAVLVVLVVLTAFVVVKYGGESARLKAASAETQKLQGEALREESRLTADVKREDQLGRTRVDLVNNIILKKTFSWTALFSEFEKALPPSSYITMLSPGFTAEGSSVAIRLRVTSRSLEDLLSLINNLSAAGFKGIQVGGETRNEEGRTIAEISLTYERAF